MKKRGKSVERIEFPRGPKYLEDPLRDGPGKINKKEKGRSL